MWLPVSHDQRFSWYYVHSSKNPLGNFFELRNFLFSSSSDVIGFLNIYTLFEILLKKKKISVLLIVFCPVSSYNITSFFMSVNHQPC